MRYPLAWVAAEQDVALMGYSPYEGVGALGQAAPPGTAYMGAHEDVLEVKHVLHRLGQQARTRGATETRYREILLEGPYASAWEGAAADELVMALSRHTLGSGVTGPYWGLTGSKFGAGIVGGPQATRAGLDVLRKAAEATGSAMPRYAAWRDGGGTTIAAITKHGPFWDEKGYTPVASDGVPEYVAAADQVDQSLIDCWNQLFATQNEAARQLLLDECVLPMRLAHHQAALEANKHQPDPDCGPNHVYDRATGTCRLGGQVTLPEQQIELDKQKARAHCIEQYMAEGMSRRKAEKLCPYGPPPTNYGSVGLALALGAGAGLGLWYLTRKRKPAR